MLTNELPQTKINQLNNKKNKLLNKTYSINQTKKKDINNKKMSLNNMPDKNSIKKLNNFIQFKNSTIYKNKKKFNENLIDSINNNNFNDNIIIKSKSKNQLLHSNSLLSVLSNKKSHLMII